ncbi:MarR family transcriptional regulator [Lactococcus hodotermopsidis]|uniref:MarR family transcriptional regulator n=1 Tax=Pseudolactococcus hodotermopsidis TaxID=2709157 RepID=A0A6A0BCF3_9LACT|nr:hypothetical protein [Lactococcus hodotermopsidis]GFH42171.1 MarR family transcriptional regulator [Lactococcus hodotermopsidis]
MSKSNKIDPKMQEIVTRLFILQNKLQTVGNQLQDNVTMKQYMLISLLQATNEPNNLSILAQKMGSSRQNVKKVAQSLAKKEYIRFKSGKQNAIFIELTEKALACEKRTREIERLTLETLFQSFETAELSQLLTFFEKLSQGVAQVENKVKKGINK